MTAFWFKLLAALIVSWLSTCTGIYILSCAAAKAGGSNPQLTLDSEATAKITTLTKNIKKLRKQLNHQEPKE